jgi:cellulose biosynthesis operon protein BcsF/YhjT
MDLTDIAEIFSLAAIIFIPLGILLNKTAPKWQKFIRQFFLSPRYLKPIDMKNPLITTGKSKKTS